MRGFFRWCKSNLLATSLVVVVVISVGVLVYVQVRGAALREQLAQRLTERSKIAAMTSVSVEIPPAKPNDPVQRVSITVNPAAIETLREIYTKMDREYQTIFQRVVDINRGKHLVMLEGLFPDPGLNRHMPFDARIKYREAFREMLLPYSPNPTYPRLNAGLPPTAAEINQALAQVEREFLDKQFPVVSTVAELSAKQQTDLNEQKRAKRAEVLNRRAQQIHLYAVTDLASANFPFDVGAWSAFGDRPGMDQIWDGQMGLWIQQDLVEAIGLTNRVSDPAANVISAPVKRLVSIRLVPGLVGIDSAGGVGGDVATGSPAAVFTDEQRNAERQIVAQIVESGEVSLPDDFSKAPTGRRSNTIYDVRHVWLVADVEAQRLPEFFDNLNRVNFMTILKMKVEDADEYALLKDGYVMGQGDTLRCSFLIETLWFREWTAPLMPPDVRVYLGIEKPKEATPTP